MGYFIEYIFDGTIGCIAEYSEMTKTLSVSVPMKSSPNIRETVFLPFFILVIFLLAMPWSLPLEYAATMTLALSPT